MRRRCSLLWPLVIIVCWVKVERYVVCSGSHIENWHSIVRRGLLNASNTALQVNGAAYGSGIYLSPTATMSFGYTKNWRSLTQTARHTNPVNTGSASVDPVIPA